MIEEVRRLVLAAAALSLFGCGGGGGSGNASAPPATDHADPVVYSSAEDASLPDAAYQLSNADTHPARLLTVRMGSARYPLLRTKRNT